MTVIHVDKDLRVLIVPVDFSDARLVPVVLAPFILTNWNRGRHLDLCPVLISSCRLLLRPLDPEADLPAMLLVVGREQEHGQCAGLPFLRLPGRADRHTRPATLEIGPAVH